MTEKPEHNEPPKDPHQQLMEDPKYAVHIHEAQITRIVEVLEQVGQKVAELDGRVKAQEDALYKLEETVRFGRPSPATDGPPELKDFL